MTSSELCKCKRACCLDETCDGAILFDTDGGESSEGESDDDLSGDEGDDLPGMGGVGGGMSIGGFREDDVAEYEQRDQMVWASRGEQMVVSQGEPDAASWGQGTNERSV